MSSGCGDVLSLEDLKVAKLHQLFEAEVITGRSGGVAGGADIDYATNQVTGQTQKTLPAVLRDAGFRPAGFTFSSGGTLAEGDGDLSVLWPSPGGDGQYYAWHGSLPKVIPAGSSPSSTGGVGPGAWAPIGDITLRGDLADMAQGAGLIGFSRTASYGSGTLGGYLNQFFDNRVQITSGQIVTPAQFGIMSIEQGATSPADTQAKINALCAYAESNQATVLWPKGTYVLPPSTQLKANNTRWYFAAGCVFKLYDTSVVNQDFLIMSSPVNQHFTGFTFDGNRAVQGDANFGADRCGFIVIGPDKCSFTNTTVLSSPGKGFGVTAVPNTGVVNNLTIDGVRGGNCFTQVFILDGNNMTTTWSGQNWVGNVMIGATRHAGIAINDGAHNVSFGLLYAKTGSTIWPAVDVRDCWDLQFTNTRGESGTAGCRVYSLNGTSQRISLGDFIGANALTNGVILQRVSNITGNTVGGYNNGNASGGGVGLNITQALFNGAQVPCANIKIANPVGYDTRTTKYQQYGVLVQGLFNGSLGKANAFGNTVRNVSLNRSVNNTVDYPLVYSPSSQTFTVTAGGSTDMTFNFSTPYDSGFDDIDYHVDLELDIASNGNPVTQAFVVSKSVSSCVVRVLSLSTAGTGAISMRASRKP